MGQHVDVIKNIARLESMIPSGFSSDDAWDFRSIWNQIKATGASFKGTRFPTPAEHEKAWSRFQGLVDTVKSKQNERRGNFAERQETSARIRDELLRQAEGALPYDSDLGDMILTIATGGLSLMAKLTLDAILGPFDERKAELQRASRILKETWDRFSAQKSMLLRDDKDTVFHALKNAQDKLDDMWNQYKVERQRTWDTYQETRKERHESWRDRTLQNIRSNEERLSKLEGVVDHKRRHMDTLYDKLSDARSDDYRSRVEGWISEERESIDDIQRKIDEINGWIAEDRQKLDQ